MNVDDRIRGALEELAPPVSTAGVLAVLEARLATAPPPPPPPAAPGRWRRWLGGGAAIVVLAGVVLAGVRDGSNEPAERASGPSSTSTALGADPSGTDGAPTTSAAARSTTSAVASDGSTTTPARSDGSPTGAPLAPTPARPVVPSTTTPLPWTTAVPSTSTTTVATTTTSGPTTTTTTPTTTTTRPGAAAPVVSDGTLSTTEVWELGPAACAGPTTVVVGVRVTSEGRIASVAARPGILGGKPVAMVPVGGGRYEASFGPYPVGTVPVGLSLPVAVSVTATDTAGQTGQLQVGAFTIRSVSSC